jgi:hypothetical protein
MKLTKSWGMNKKVITGLALVIFGACRNITHPISPVCFSSEITSKSDFIFTTSLLREGECNYRLTSPFLENLPNNQLIFDGDNVYVNLSGQSGKNELLFSFKDRVNDIHTITIKHNNWFSENNNAFRVIAYQVELINILHKNEERFAVIKIHDFIPTPEPLETGPLDGVVIFSNKQGFIGSYYQSPMEDFMIIQKTGNILDSLIDYSKYKFRRIK